MFMGCPNQTLELQVLGNIIAPSGIDAWDGEDMKKWLEFSNVNGLVVNGNGKIDGQGEIWWQKADQLDARPTVSN